MVLRGAGSDEEAAMRLRDRIAVVTGADSGIGPATAEEFAKEGAGIAVPWHKDRAGA